MKNPETELKYPEEIEGANEKKGTSRQEKFFRFIFASSILLAATRPDSIPTEVEASRVDDRFPQGEVYIPPEDNTGGVIEDEVSITREIREDFGLFPDFLTPSEESYFPPSDVGSVLDSGGFALPEETIEEEGVVKKVAVEQVLDNPFLGIEKRLSPEVKDILSLQPELNFDENGQLYYEEEGDIKPVLTVETDRFLLYSDNEQLKGVDFFVIHYDAAPQTLRSGAYRTVLNTINGLNREGNPSVQFCVDSYPVNDEFEGGDGVGIIHSQPAGPIPYKGWHVVIGYELATGREDLNRVKTADLYEKLGVGQDFVDFIRAGNKDFDSFSLALEQVGTQYSVNFPEQFPPNQQIANVLALVKAASERYGLSVWDIVGHHEIQEKSDPGDEYMLTLRFLLGLSSLLDEQLPDDFLETDNPYDYFVVLRDYSIARMGEERYRNWDNIYKMDSVISEMEAQKGVAERDTEQEIFPLRK